jgi:hypothetical protein
VAETEEVNKLKNAKLQERIAKELKSQEQEAKVKAEGAAEAEAVKAEALEKSKTPEVS